MKDEFGDLPTITPGIYQHYKGHMYRVLGVGCHSETLEYYVVYSPLEPKEGIPELWLRPYNMFNETIKVNDEIVPRFRRLNKE
jgi:hypothetical protein